MTDSLNPWQPRWVQIESDQEDSLYEGMSVRIEGDEPETVVGIRSYDVDVDGDGYGNVTPTGVKVEEDGEWWSLHEVEFLAHQLDYGKARYEAKLIMRKATSRVTYRDGQPRYNGRMPVSPSSFVNPAALVRVRQYDAQGRWIRVRQYDDLPF
jgi:hypothetical protein